MNLWNSLSGMTEAELVSADLLGAFTRLTDAKIPIRNVNIKDDMTAHFTVARKDYPLVERLCRRRGDLIQKQAALGLFWTINRFLHRPVLLAGLFLLLILELFLPTRVLFLEVEGNKRIPSRVILSAAEDCGIRFGASRRRVRSEKVKNALLSAVPDLQWAGVNTYGCKAVISIRERAVKMFSDPEEMQIRNIIASADGVIISCTAQKGNLLCYPGQVVKKGEILISGFIDCGLCIQAVKAEGDILAQTQHSFSAISPSAAEVRTEAEYVRRYYSLLIGKKRIKIWKDSGIWDSSCGRMYEEQYMILPGSFRLPIALAVDQISVYRTSNKTIPAEESESLLSAFAEKYLRNHMIAGAVTEKREQSEDGDGFVYLSGKYNCTEMIGRAHWEQIGEYNGETN